MSDRENWFVDELERRGVSRREFLGFCTVMTSALALPAALSARVAKAIKVVPVKHWWIEAARRVGTNLGD